jgi:hypothetical protein
MPPRKKWNPEHMRAGFAAMRNKEMGSLKAAHVFNCLQSISELYAKNVEKFSIDVAQPRIARKPLLSLEVERETQNTA